MVGTKHVAGGFASPGTTHIRVSSELVNHSVVEVARVAQKAAGNVVGVLEASEGIVEHGELRALPELELPALGGLVQLHHPAVMGRGVLGLYMVLELDNVRVVNVSAVLRLHQRSDVGAA